MLIYELRIFILKNLISIGKFIICIFKKRKYDIMDSDLKSNLKKHLPWLMLLIVFCVWLKFDIFYNSPSPLENGYILKGKLVYSSDNMSFLYDKFSSVVPAYVIGIGAKIGGYIGARITSLILSFVMLFFFYKFSDKLFDDKFASAISVLFLAIQGPLVFIGKYATSDIVALTFLSAFLWVFMFLIKESQDTKDRILIFSIVASMLYVFSFLSNYLIILYLPLAIIILFKNNPKAGKYFTFISLIILAVLTIGFYQTIKTHFLIIYYLPFIDDNQVYLTKLFVRIAEYIAIPIMLVYAAQQMIWKTHYRTSMIYILFGTSLIIPAYLLIFRDIFSIFRIIPLSLIFLIPLGGMILSKFLNMSANYKYSAIFILYFVGLLSFWQTTLLEESYPNTDKMINLIGKDINPSTTMYSEDPYLLAAKFYPKLNIKNFINLDKYKVSQGSGYRDDRNILAKLKNGEVDFVAFNSIIHPGLTQTLKSEYLHDFYQKIFSEESNFNSMMFPENSCYLEVYKLKFSFKPNNKVLAKIN
jgi:hypothetical protein